MNARTVEAARKARVEGPNGDHDGRTGNEERHLREIVSDSTAVVVFARTTLARWE
jgi:hypothetical protein